MIATQPVLPSDFTQVACEKRENPGILVFTLEGQLLYMNPEARERCREINRAFLGRHVRGVLPQAVVNLYSEIVRRISQGTDLKSGESVQLRAVIKSQDLSPPMLVRGFGIPCPGNGDHARILIMLDPIAPRDPVSLSQLNRWLELTDRGRDVVQFLIQGLTSKEIAEQMGITEQTVKEHIHRLMRKTKTTTRTGMLAKLLLESTSDGIQGPLR